MGAYSGGGCSGNAGKRAAWEERRCTRGAETYISAEGNVTTSGSNVSPSDAGHPPSRDKP
jgi:hypothetical protein